MLLSTRRIQRKPLSTRTMTIDVAKHKNNANEHAKHKNNANEPTKQENNDK